MEISIIIPVKNGERYLRQCLDSVFEQSFDKDYEVIVGVDPSEDKTLEILDEYKKKHSNLVVENRRGLGVAVNRFDSLKIAKGKYICFLDADDYYHKDFLKVMYEEVNKGYDIVNSSFFIDRDGKIKKNGFVKAKEMNSVEACNAILKDSYFRSFLWNKIFRKELFDNDKCPRNWPKGHIFEDLGIVYFLAMHSKKVKSIKTPLYFYRDNRESLTKVENKDRFKMHLNVFAYVRHLTDENKNKLYLKGYRRYFFRSKMSLWYDGYSTRHVLGHGGLKELKLHKAELKALKNKNPLHHSGFEEFIANLEK